MYILNEKSEIPQLCLPQPARKCKTKAFTLHTWSNLPGKMALFDQLAKLKQRSKKSSSKSQSSNLQNSSPGGTTGNCGFCVSTPNVSTISQANTLRRPNVNKSQDWLNVDKEKSVRFTLPPDEVKRRERFYFLSLFISFKMVFDFKLALSNANLFLLCNVETVAQNLRLG